MIFLRLFFEFFKTGLFSIGGGLATIPFLQDMGEATGWFTNQELTTMIAVSVLKLGKSTLKNAPAVCIFLAVLALAEVGSLLPLDPASPVGAALGFLSSPAILVVLAGVTGWLLSLLRPGKEGGEAR